MSNDSTAERACPWCHEVKPLTTTAWTADDGSSIDITACSDTCADALSQAHSEADDDRAQREMKSHVARESRTLDEDYRG